MILAIRTDQSRSELYLLDKAGKSIQKTSWEAGHELSQTILNRILKILAARKTDFKNLSGIVVYRGPGSFTSLRIGVTVANTLAYGLKIPVVGVSGQTWLKQGTKKLATAQLGKYVVPKYDRPPHITRPR